MESYPWTQTYLDAWRDDYFSNTKNDYKLKSTLFSNDHILKLYDIFIIFGYIYHKEAVAVHSYLSKLMEDIDVIKLSLVI